MKKRNLMGVALVAIALFGCSEIETTGVAQNQMIGFDAYANKVSRASVDATVLGHDAFSVFGQYDVETTPQTPFNGTSVIYNTSTPAWEYNPLIPWVPGKTYVFGAIAPISTAASMNYKTKTYSFNSATVIDQVTQKDILVATPVEVTAAAAGGGNNSVAFTFNHILSKLGFSFAVDKTTGNAWEGEIAIEITGFQMTNVVKSATYTNSVWTNYGSEKATFTTAPSLTTSYDGALTVAHSTREFFVLPQTLGTQKVTLTLQIQDLHGNIIEDNVQATAVLTATDNEWKSGYKYHYTFYLGKNLLSGATGQEDIYIVFDVQQLSDWTTENVDIETAKP